MWRLPLEPSVIHCLLVVFVRMKVVQRCEIFCPMLVLTHNLAQRLLELLFAQRQNLCTYVGLCVN
jgi:hypothetical protein